MSVEIDGYDSWKLDTPDEYEHSGRSYGDPHAYIARRIAWLKEERKCAPRPAKRAELDAQIAYLERSLDGRYTR